MNIEGCPHGPSYSVSDCPECTASRSAQEQAIQQAARDLEVVKERLNAYRQDQTVYCQGIWLCRVERDEGASIIYEPLEGYGPGQQGKLFTAPKYLFTPWRENQVFLKARDHLLRQRMEMNEELALTEAGEQQKNT